MYTQRPKRTTRRPVASTHTGRLPEQDDNVDVANPVLVSPADHAQHVSEHAAHE